MKLLKCLAAAALLASAAAIAAESPKPKNVRVYIVRHGRTEWNKEGRLQGQLDVKLDEKGLEQAEKTAERFKNVKLAAVLVSPLSRARVTGETIARAAGCENIIADPGFMEINLGAVQGKTMKEILASDLAPIAKQWAAAPETVRYPGEGGESLGMVQKRAVEALERLAAPYEGSVVIATHGAAATTILAHYLGSPLTNYWRFKLDNCGVSCVEFNAKGAARVSLMNDTSHLK
ncbi:MAG: histidine phosphatase family protein [Pyramidobacter sp.]|nr:histidine phosphatase family protein [Pyramidobacter sp.]